MAWMSIWLPAYWCSTKRRRPSPTWSRAIDLVSPRRSAACVKLSLWAVVTKTVMPARGARTAWGALFRGLRLREGDRLLIRGGTTSVGLAAAAIARAHGAQVASTSRYEQSRALVEAAGAQHFIVDDGAIAGQLQALWPGGADKVLMKDYLRCLDCGLLNALFKCTRVRKAPPAFG